jgi:hypothetical protein
MGADSIRIAHVRHIGVRYGREQQLALIKEQLAWQRNFTFERNTSWQTQGITGLGFPASVYEQERSDWR